MTPDQRSLARHALGLPNKTKQSNRNRFVAGPGHVDHDDWLEMVDNGQAIRRHGKTLPFGGDDLFYLTEAGARAALNKGETVCPEDFPQVPS